MRTIAVLLTLLNITPALAWEEINHTDRITGDKLTGISRQAHETLLSPQRRASQTSPSAYLMIRCNGNKAAVFYAVDNWLVAGRGRNTVLYKLDDDKAVTSSAWSASTDHSAIGLWERKGVANFLTKAKGKKKLIFRTSTSVFGETEAVFDITGLDKSVEPVRKACGI